MGGKLYFANICLFFYERGPPEHDPPQFGWVQCTSKNINIWLIVTFCYIFFTKILLAFVYFFMDSRTAAYTGPCQELHALSSLPRTMIRVLESILNIVLFVFYS